MACSSCTRNSDVNIVNNQETKKSRGWYFLLTSLLRPLRKKVTKQGIHSIQCTYRLSSTSMRRSFSFLSSSCPLSASNAFPAASKPLPSQLTLFPCSWPCWCCSNGGELSMAAGSALESGVLLFFVVHQIEIQMQQNHARSAKRSCVTGVKIAAEQKKVKYGRSNIKTLAKYQTRWQLSASWLYRKKGVLSFLFGGRESHEVGLCFSKCFESTLDNCIWSHA